MNTRLYVGNLSFNTTAEGVRAAFTQFGTVSDVHLVSDRETGRSRGFAFVTMGTTEEASKAIEGMDGKTLDGRPLRVNEAEQRQARGGGGGGGGFRGGGGGGYRGGGGGGYDGGGGGGGGGDWGGGGGGGDDRGGGRGGRGRGRGGGGGDRW
jgi:cold-inducible RNA-binding protein